MGATLEWASFLKAIFCDCFIITYFLFNSSHDNTYWKLETWRRMDEMHKFKYLPPCAKGYFNKS